jgi:hypothetical protein
VRAAAELIVGYPRGGPLHHYPRLSNSRAYRLVHRSTRASLAARMKAVVVAPTAPVAARSGRRCRVETSLVDLASVCELIADELPDSPRRALLTYAATGGREAAHDDQNGRHGVVIVVPLKRSRALPQYSPRYRNSSGSDSLVTQQPRSYQPLEYPRWLSRPFSSSTRVFHRALYS